MIPTGYDKRLKKTSRYSEKKSIISQVWKMRLDLARDMNFSYDLDHFEHYTKKYGNKYAFFGEKMCVGDIRMLRLAGK